MNIRVGILTAPKIEVEQREHTFIVHNVRIGIGFHWQQFEDEEFEGELEIVSNPDGTQTAVNIIDLEDYLTSVISSEMSADAPLELLKAQAVIARSWVLRAIGHTSHTTFDVCADDHCQRYYGIARRNARAIEAVKATKGEVLAYNPTPLHLYSSTPNICDCRYHKCCGGKTEVFETCWEGEHQPYLESVECPYCNPTPLHLYSSTPNPLNSFDRSADNYHDWTVTYTAEELAAILKQKTGLDFGQVLELRPLQRGVSGRINRLEVVGSKRTEILSGELTIRQALSPSTLYSSWFEVETLNYLFRLRGHGWGHGVGLCQMGAAEMAKQGYTYEQILAFYYQHTHIECLNV